MNANKLLDLINIYHKEDGKGDSYGNVILELMNGNSLLLLPSANDTPEVQKTITESGHKTLKLSSVFNTDGKRVLCVFTDEQTLSDWAQKPMPYKMLSSKDVLKLCEMSAIQRIVINIGSPNVFALEQSSE
ncbi:SseB family protein [Flavobacterium hauense]